MVFHGIVVDPPDESHFLQCLRSGLKAFLEPRSRSVSILQPPFSFTHQANQSQLVSTNVQLLTGNACLLKIRLAVRPILDVLKENVECEIVILMDIHSDLSTSQVVHGHSNNGNTWLARVDMVSSTNS